MTAPARKAPPVAAGLAAAVLFALAACISGPAMLSPPPARVTTLDGFGSLSLRGAGGSLRGRFSFLLSLPDMGRIEVLDPFGRTRAVLIFRESTAVLVVPSRRVYWSGPEEDLMEGFLGFGLGGRDLAGLIGGRWAEAGAPEAAGWALERDREGRVSSGAKDGFRFEVEEFFGKTSVPRSVGISRDGEPGRLKVLQIRFNRPPRGDAFGLSALNGMDRKTWAEMEELLRDED
jgi:outer membrane biogenesis lipoprotein LolB